MTTTRKPSRTLKRPRVRAPEIKIVRREDRVRWSKVQTAQARIASGYYERDDVQTIVVEHILRELYRH